MKLCYNYKYRVRILNQKILKEVRTIDPKADNYNDELKRTVSSKINNLLSSKKVTHSQICEMLPDLFLNEEEVSRVRRGSRLVSLKKLYALSVALDVDMNYFFSDT